MDDRQAVGQCASQSESIMRRFDFVAEHPLPEDRKRGVESIQKAKLEESKKLRLNNEGELPVTGSVTSFDKKAILAALHNKEKQKNMNEDENARNSRQNQKCGTKSKKTVIKAKDPSDLNAMKSELKTMDEPALTITKILMEEFPSGSHFHQQDITMEINMSLRQDAKRKPCSSANLVSSTNNSSHQKDSGHSHMPSQPAINHPKVSNVDTAAENPSQLKSQPCIHDTSTSLQPFTRSILDFKAAQMPVCLPHSNHDDSSSKAQTSVALPPGFLKSQVYDDAIDLVSIPKFSESVAVFEAQMKDIFSENIPQHSAQSCLPSDINDSIPQIGQRLKGMDEHKCQHFQCKGMCSMTNAHTLSETTLDVLNVVNSDMLNTALSEYKRALEPHLSYSFKNRLSSSSTSLLPESNSQHFNSTGFPSGEVEVSKKCMLNKKSDSLSMTEDMSQRNKNHIEELQRSMSESLRITGSEIELCSNVEKHTSSLGSTCKIFNHRQEQYNLNDIVTNNTHKTAIEKTDDEHEVKLLTLAKKQPQTVTTHGYQQKGSVEKRNTKIYNIKQMTSIWDFGDMNTFSNHKECSAIADKSNEKSTEYVVKDGLFDSCENLRLKDESQQSERCKEEADHRMPFEPRTEKNKSWTWLAPHDKRKQNTIKPEKRKESAQRKGMLTLKCHQFSKPNEDASKTRRVHFQDIKSEVARCDSATEGVSPGMSGMQDNNVKSAVTESFSNEILTKKNLRQMLENPTFFSSQYKSTHHKFTPTQYISNGKENVPTNCKDTISDLKANNCDSDGELWDEESNVGIDPTSLSHNFMSATKSNLKYPNHEAVYSSNRAMGGPPGLQARCLDPIPFPRPALNLSKVQNRKNLCPIRKPKTATQCMQISQATVSRGPMTCEDKYAAMESRCELFPQNGSSNTGAAPDVKTTEQDKSNEQFEEVRHTVERKEKSTKRPSNPAALFQKALLESMEGSSNVLNCPNSMNTKTDNGIAVHSVSGAVQFPSRPSFKTVGKLPRLNVANSFNF